MHPELNQYLTVRQFNKICKYWKMIEKYTNKIEKFNYKLSTCYYPIYYNDFSENEIYLSSDDDDDDEPSTYSDGIYTYISKSARNHREQEKNRIDRYRDKIRGRLEMYEQEYHKYVKDLGYELNDPTQNEHLFNLLTNGILLDGVEIP